MNEFEYQRTVIGYHGCNEAVVSDVLLHGRKLRPSANDYDWLGSGIYFWEHGPHRAWDWARRRDKSGALRCNKPAVLGAILHLGTCFDLLDTANTSLLAELYPEFVKACQAEGRRLPENRAPKDSGDEDMILRHLDCAMLNWTLLALERAGIRHDTVRCAFSEGTPAFAGSKIMSQSHIQIAVRNPEVILGFFRPAIDFTAEPPMLSAA